MRGKTFRRDSVSYGTCIGKRGDCKYMRYMVTEGRETGAGDLRRPNNGQFNSLK